MFDQTLCGTVLKNVYYANTPDDDRMLDIYFPKYDGRPFPLAINIHGGAWSEGTKDWSWFSDRLPLNGIMGVSINYRLSPSVHAPVHLQDVKTAIRFCRANAEKYNVDPDRIAVYGHSAGGHLAAMAGVTADLDMFPDDCPWQRYSDAVNVAGNFSGPSDLQGIPQQDPIFSEAIFGTHTANEPIYMAYSPLTYIRPSLPPFLNIHGDADDTVDVDNAYRLHQALLKFGNISELLIFEGADHGFEIEGVSMNEKIWDRWLQFLKKYL